MPSSHSSIVVGDSNQVVAARPCIGINKEFRHVQVTVKKQKTKTRKNKTNKTQPKLSHVNSIFNHGLVILEPFTLYAL